MSIETQLILIFESGKHEFIDFELEGQYPEYIHNNWEL